MATINSVKLKRTGFSDLTLPFKYGITVKEVLNQDLDTGSLVIVKTNELDIQPFDIIEITYETISTLKFLVGTIQSKIIKFGTTKQYQYDIGLVSLTTELQRIILPSRSITQSLDGNNDYTIKEIMENYLEMYAPQYSLTTTMITKLGTTKAPESQWTRPTLFEVFNDLLKPLGMVVQVLLLSTNQKKIHFLDLDEEGSAIDQTKINNTEIRQDLTEYASDIEIDAQNVYNRNAITHTPTPYTPKTSEQLLITTDNQEVILNKPIFEIKKVIVKFPKNIQQLPDPLDTEMKSLDITDRVVNKKVWDTFADTNSISRVADTATIKYKRNYLYYEEGKNYIDISFKEDDWLGVLAPDHRAIENVIYYTLLAENDSQAATAATAFSGFLQDKIGFEVEYLTTDNILFRVAKDVKPRNKSVLISSQESSLIDAEAFGKQQQEFVNRIGNREMTITGRYDTYSSIPDLKDYIDDFVLVEREIQIHESHYNFKGLLTEHYSKDNMFAGINSAKKYFSIAEANEASISNHLTQVNLTVSNNDEANSSFLGQTESYVVENFGKKDKYIQGALVLTDETDTATPSGQPKNEILLETTTHAIGKSVIITMQMTDNFNSHLKAIETSVAGADRHLNKYVRYVDLNGRFEELKIHLYRYDPVYSNRGISFKPLHIDPTFEGYTNTEAGGATISHFSLFEDATNETKKLPEVSYQATYRDATQTGQYYYENTNTYNVINTNAKVYSTGTSSNNYVKRYKDNREITHETLQFNFGTSVSGNGSTQQIFITNEFIKYTPFLFNNSSDYGDNFKVAFSTTLKYNRDSKTYKGTLLPHSTTGLNNSVKLQLTGNEIRIVDTSTGSTGFLWDNLKDNIISYAICDGFGNILIAVNKSGTYEPLYINR